MKTIRTVSKIVERNEKVSKTPKFSKDDYVEIYSGYREGHCFVIKDIRYNYDYNNFEYLYGNILLGGWIPENSLVGIKVKRSHSSAG